MNISQINNWVQIVAALGVIAGLLLVAYELNQNTKQLYGASIQGIHAAYRSQALIEIESNIHELYVKSFESPDELSTEEILKLDTYYVLIIDQYEEWENMYEIGAVRYSGAENLVNVVDKYFAGRFGRAWYSANRYWLKASIIEVLDRELADIPIQEQPPRAEQIRSRLRESN